MGIFGNLFGSTTSQDAGTNIPWVPLNDLGQLEEIKQKSKHKPQVIFKHSTTCGISRMVLNMFGSNFNIDAEAIDLYFLDLHANREISNEVAITFQVLHQSPQLLVIKNEETVFHTSHGAISEVDLKELV